MTHDRIPEYRYGDWIMGNSPLDPAEPRARPLARRLADAHYTPGPRYTPDSGDERQLGISVWVYAGPARRTNDRDKAPTHLVVHTMTGREPEVFAVEDTGSLMELLALWLPVVEAGARLDRIVQRSGE